MHFAIRHFLLLVYPPHPQITSLARVTLVSYLDSFMGTANDFFLDR
jgi:hypothetical protein